MILQKTFAGLA